MFMPGAMAACCAHKDRPAVSRAAPAIRSHSRLLKLKECLLKFVWRWISRAGLRLSLKE
jgi:hypothetical protein